ncbi:hypothetical protein NDU88_001786 [Pleurodeles waltl]|uniref:Uncharacterized protein n=1 Tax=Pleurodeles waltl TaxID=8319 RepID=A0AAV7LYM7_PLEWA|nr:hypothetical protein NDU88_001786 [Pleurodeles waltl]
MRRSLRPCESLSFSPGLAAPDQEHSLLVRCESRFSLILFWCGYAWVEELVLLVLMRHQRIVRNTVPLSLQARGVHPRLTQASEPPRLWLRSRGEPRTRPAVRFACAACAVAAALSAQAAPHLRVVRPRGPGYDRGPRGRKAASSSACGVLLFSSATSRGVDFRHGPLGRDTAPPPRHAGGAAHGSFNSLSLPSSDSSRGGSTHPSSPPVKAEYPVRSRARVRHV